MKKYIYIYIKNIYIRWKRQDTWDLVLAPLLLALLTTSFLIWKTSVHSSSVDYTYRSAIIFNQSAEFSPTLLAKTPVALFNVFDGYGHQ